MTPQPDTTLHQRVKALFLDALDRPEAARPAWLAAACGGDGALRAEVEALLAAHDGAEATGRLERPLFDRPALADDGPGEGPAAGRTVGPWRLIERIGAGGMGAVYRAVRADGAYERAVAVKLLHPGLDAGGALARRLAAERRILARLEHPGIARLYDGGVSADGLPYLVMELVDGAPLTAYAERHALPADDRLRVFLQVCDAVAYAHRHLVVHRDLKPSNVLVADDGRGQPQAKLLDFGIATLLSGPDTDAALTRTAGAMTPAYAAPEQLRGEAVTTATDVYALGVLLYELLTGRRPYDLTGKTASEVERVVCETAPPRPSQAAPPEHARRLRGDLDLIAAKALEKEPARRYASAEALAEDIRCHLDGRPVGARPPSAGYRVGKFVRRHRAGVAAAAAVVLALVGGLGAALWQARVAAAERDAAERRFEVAREAARAMLYDVHDAVADLPGSTAAREVIVRRSLDYLGRLAAEAGDDAALRLDLASAYLRVGNVLGNPNDHNLGRLSDAQASYRRGLAVLPIAPSESLAVPVGHVRGVLYEKLADVTAYRGDPGGALALMDSALARYRGNADAEPASPERRLTLAVGHLKRGDYAGNPNFPNAGRPADALRDYEAMLVLLNGVDETADPDRLLRLRGLNYERLGSLHLALGDPTAAHDAYARSLAIREVLGRRDPASTNVRRDVGVAHEKLGEVLRAQGHVREALAEYESAAAVYRRLFEADSQNAQARQTLAIGHLHLGDILGGAPPNLGDRTAARHHYARAVALLRPVAEADPANEQVRAVLAEARRALDALR
jgi:non-specific serine/threonine protein kinase/serine/threonine-protein kinase